MSLTQKLQMPPELRVPELEAQVTALKAELKFAWEENDDLDESSQDEIASLLGELEDTSARILAVFEDHYGRKEREKFELALRLSPGVLRHDRD